MGDKRLFRKELGVVEWIISALEYPNHKTLFGNKRAGIVRCIRFIEPIIIWYCRNS